MIAVLSDRNLPGPLGVILPVACESLPKLVSGRLDLAPRIDGSRDDSMASGRGVSASRSRKRGGIEEWRRAGRLHSRSLSSGAGTDRSIVSGTGGALLIPLVKPVFPCFRGRCSKAATRRGAFSLYQNRIK